MKRRGFTIVELIIVVSIMGILLTIGVINLRSSQANGRDAERKVDIDTIALHLETYYTSGTNATGASSSECTGGSITHSGGYTIHTFTVGGTLTCSSSFTADVLVVAGGGGGGGGNAGNPGGGGAGDVLVATAAALSGSMAVTVGAGGSKGTAGAYSDTSGTYGGNGSNSVFAGLTANGGGGGGCYNYGADGVYGHGSGGRPGGSGGGMGQYPGYASSVASVTAGSTGTGITNYGNNGGNNGGSSYGGTGGGGAAAVGGNATGTNGTYGGVGGAGTSPSLGGTSYGPFGGGGGGASHSLVTNAASGGSGGGGAGGNKTTAGVAGTANTGGGGGAGSDSQVSAGAGGSGIVIVRYLAPSTTTIGTYPSTALTATTASMIQYLRDIDTKSITAPGITDPTLTFISATCIGVCVQTTIGVTPQPTKDQYVYQPLHSDGTLCNDTTECRKFNLYYKLENATTDCPAPNNICMITSRNQ